MAQEMAFGGTSACSVRRQTANWPTGMVATNEEGGRQEVEPRRRDGDGEPYIVAVASRRSAGAVKKSYKREDTIDDSNLMVSNCNAGLVGDPSMSRYYNVHVMCSHQSARLSSSLRSDLRVLLRLSSRSSATDRWLRSWAIDEAINGRWRPPTCSTGRRLTAASSERRWRRRKIIRQRPPPVRNCRKRIQ